jgi:hypothetical protein
MSRRLIIAGSLAILASCGCGSAPSPTPPEALAPNPKPGFAVSVSAPVLTAGQHVGGPGEPELTFAFRVPSDLHGGGLPDNLYAPRSDRAVVEIELPFVAGGASDDEHAHRSMGVGQFDAAVLCPLPLATCPEAASDGAWRATEQLGASKPLEVQLAAALRVRDDAGAPYAPTFTHALGAYLPPGRTLHGGEVLRLTYRGHAPRRATDWTDHPLIAHVRYRSFAAGGSAAGPWTVLDDAQVEPIQIHPGDVAFVHALAPLDVAVGKPFPLALVTTDRFGNPSPITGSVRVTDAAKLELAFAGAWRQEVQVMLTSPGHHRFVPEFGSARAIYHYTHAWAGVPAQMRMVGDVHTHTGDGGAQRKFLGAFMPGDHAALFSRSRDALRYMDEVAGLDFGAISEHASAWERFVLPKGVTDPAFQPGGVCAKWTPVPGLTSWWPYQQSVSHQFGGGATGRFVAFPAFEWHGQHSRPGDISPLHRVVLFRDFDPHDELPILPYAPQTPPQCPVRFVAGLGLGPERALIIPHLMIGFSANIDWQLTYEGDGPLGRDLATREQIEQYQRVGEIFSSRAYDDPRFSVSETLLTLFEGDDVQPGPWSFRYGWRDLGAHIGVIGSSDNHSQMPGVNDDVRVDGGSYHQHEAGGLAFVIGDAHSRDGVWRGLEARRTYGSSGVRAWLDFNAAGVTMGAQTRVHANVATGVIDLAVGLVITRVELWAAPAGAPAGAYARLLADEPHDETYRREITIKSPLAQGAAPAEWLYYVRAFLSRPGSLNGPVDDAVWSSPIWITWGAK